MCGKTNDQNNKSVTSDNMHTTKSTNKLQHAKHSPISFAREKIQQIIKSDLYRTLHHGHTDGRHIIINGHKMINLCSNDYLGMDSNNNNLKQSNTMNNESTLVDLQYDYLKNETLQIPASSRLLSGSSPMHHMLESALCASKSYESALVYPTGYMANIGVIPVLAGRDSNNNNNSVIFSDALNHASIVDGCRLAHATIIIYNHNDMEDLESKISKYDNYSGRKLIITEGVFSMDGDIAHLEKISNMAKRHNAILIVDDAHGDFALGADGRGTPEHLGLSMPSCKVHVYISSLSKALGSFGGYVASDKSVIDLCINQSRSFIYTSALPPQIARHAYLRVIDKKMLNLRKKRLEQNVQLLSSALENAGYATLSKTHIMPILVHDESQAVKLAKHLFCNGIYAPAIRYPTVPRGQARLRISATAWLEDDDMHAIQHALESARL